MMLGKPEECQRRGGHQSSRRGEKQKKAKRGKKMVIAI